MMIPPMISSTTAGSAQPRREADRQRGQDGDGRDHEQVDERHVRHERSPVRAAPGAGWCAPSRPAMWSATRRALAMMVRVGLTAVLDTKKLESTT